MITLNPMELRQGFLDLMRDEGHYQLPEQSLLGQNGDSSSFFTMAAAKLVEPIYLGNVRPMHKRIAVVQRMFSANQLKYAGLFPVATPMEVQMSIFHFGEATASGILGLTLSYLRTLDIPLSSVYFISPGGYGIDSVLESLQYPEQNVIQWDNPMEYKMNGQSMGHYGRLCLYYNRGLFPVADITFCQKDSGLYLESCLYLDRLSFVSRGAKTWFSTELYSSIVYLIESTASPTNEPALVFSTSVLLRTLTALLGDGLEPSAKGRGYVARKIIRQIVRSWWLANARAPQLGDVVPECVEGLRTIGYDYGGVASRIAAAIGNEQKEATEQLDEALAFLDKNVGRLPSNPDESVRQIIAWRDTHGIHEDVIFQALRAMGVDVDVLRNVIESQHRPFFNLKMHGYPTPDGGSIEDPRLWLREAEARLYNRTQ